MPEVPCVRVPREDGERARRDLADRDLVDGDHEITVADGTIYLPVTAPAAVPDEYEVVQRDVPARETTTTPADLLGYEPTYERLGEIVIVDEDDPARAREIAEAVMASDVRAKTVLRRASKVKGETRLREWDLLAGGDTETVHREYGFEYLLDVREVYFSPRLATDRHLVTESIGTGERVFDMFAGVGPFVIPAAARGATAVGVDLNPVAVGYLRANAERNGVADRVTAIEGDVRAVTGYDGWADRVVMNLPHSADEFLDVAVRLAGEDCLLHYYDIQNDEDPFGPGERAIRAAAGDAYEVTVETERVVRSYAPHELNVRLDARLGQA
jgi:tRNA (guanine37-N1)-methyltransferase